MASKKILTIGAEASLIYERVVRLLNNNGVLYDGVAVGKMEILVSLHEDVRLRHEKLDNNKPLTITLYEKSIARFNEYAKDVDAFLTAQNPYYQKIKYTTD